MSSEIEHSESPERRGFSSTSYPANTATVSEHRRQVIYTPGQLKTIADTANYIPPKTRIRLSDRDGLLGTVLLYFRPKRRSAWCRFA